VPDPLDPPRATVDGAKFLPPAAFRLPPARLSMRIYTEIQDSQARQSLDGGDVLPGFALPLSVLFATPKRGTE
jgi:hypothetical protein